MREAFKKQRFNRSSVRIIEHANAIIAEYQAADLYLTLRQLYYQFVSRDLIENNLKSYKRLGSVINDARLAGAIDWNAIEDRTRNVRRPSTWSNPAAIIDSAAASYKEDLWRDQGARVEVWIEKDALVGVIEKVCGRWRLPYFACRGYSSQSEQYRAGKRFADVRRQGLRPIVLHLGDHDPSGLDMTRDNADRLAMFARQGVEVRRLALNYDQVEQYSPPPNPAKESDSRAAGYIEEFGSSSWELDALEPTVIGQLIEDEVRSIVDVDRWEALRDAEDANRETIETAAANWPAVASFVAENFE